MDNGWSLKKLNKFIVMSAAYQQDSRANPTAMKSDPTNQWLWRTNIQRLDFEQVRDSLLTFGEKLDLTMGGPPFALAASTNGGKGRYASVDLDSTKSPNRRSVYAFIDRSALPEMLNTFDFANPDMSTGERLMTTVPQQALFMMNSPFLVQQVKNILARPDIAAATNNAEKVRLIFRTTFQRQPSAAELKLAEQFLASEAPPATSDKRSHSRFVTAGGCPTVSDTGVDWRLPLSGWTVAPCATTSRTSRLDACMTRSVVSSTEAMSLTGKASLPVTQLPNKVGAPVADGPASVHTEPASAACRQCAAASDRDADTKTSQHLFRPARTGIHTAKGRRWSAVRRRRIGGRRDVH